MTDYPAFTAEQFAHAQNAADIAYDMTLEQTGDKEQAARDYFSVMQAYHEAQRHYSVTPAVTLDQAAPLGTAKAAQFAAYTDGLSAEDVAEMERMTAETSRADDYASHTEGHW
jgi:hypothetical protein